jgi:hypothetical protein
VAGGFTVTYTEPCEISVPKDADGYGIIGEHMRVLTQAEGDFAAGTVLYLDDSKKS